MRVEDSNRLDSHHCLFYVIVFLPALSYSVLVGGLVAAHG